MKDWFKIGLAVGCGVTVGMRFGDTINTVINGVELAIIKILARSGNETAQYVCEKIKLDYASTEGETECKNDFHCM